jgi:hypothetical protein
MLMKASSRLRHKPAVNTTAGFTTLAAPTGPGDADAARSHGCPAMFSFLLARNRLGSPSSAPVVEKSKAAGSALSPS